MTALYEPYPSSEAFSSLDFLTTGFLRGGAVNPTPKPQPGDQASAFATPGDKVTQLYLQALGTHFSRLLRHA
jgi:hypothetical protein